MSYSMNAYFGNARTMEDECPATATRAGTGGAGHTAAMVANATSNRTGKIHRRFIRDKNAS